MNRRRPASQEPNASGTLDATRAPAGRPPASKEPPPSGPAGSPARPAAELGSLYASAITVLTWGFRLGAALLAAGLALALVRREPLNRSADPFSEVVPTLRAGEAAGVVDLAIIWFMLTPVAVVAVVGVGFWRAGDRSYALLSLLVLAVLGASVALAV